MSKMKQLQNVVSNLRNLADSIDAFVKSIADGKEVTVATDVTNDLTANEEQPTLEEVRALLAEKNREGHREEVKAIIQKYGANKLTSLDTKHYASVIKEVGELV
jgi:hypothetical protein